MRAGALVRAIFNSRELPGSGGTNLDYNSISTAMVDSEQRLLNCREEPALFVVDCVVQVDRESTQRLSDITRLCLSETIRAGANDCADERSQSVVECADPSHGFWRETTLLHQPRK